MMIRKLIAVLLTALAITSDAYVKLMCNSAFRRHISTASAKTNLQLRTMCKLDELPNVDFSNAPLNKLRSSPPVGLLSGVDVSVSGDAMPAAAGTRTVTNDERKLDMLLPYHGFENDFPFVDRHAEVLDIAVTNLITCFELKPIAKRKVAVASQIMGTGKTVLGCNFISALNRPRESPNEVEHIAERLLTSRHLSQEKLLSRQVIDAALKDTRDESITVRVLRAFLKRKISKSEAAVDRLVDELKRARTVFVNMGILGIDKPTLSHALGAAIAKQVLSEEGIALAPRDAPTLCEYLVKKMDRPLFIVLDEIGVLTEKDFAHWASSEGATKDMRAMRTLGYNLQAMLNVPGVRIYCTGRTEYLSLSSLTGSASPLRPFPVLLHPLKSEDIQEMFSQKWPSREDLSLIANDSNVVRSLSDQIAAFSGGNGRIVEYVLEPLQSGSRLNTEEEVSSALESAFEKVMKEQKTGVEFRFQSVGQLITDSTLELIHMYLRNVGLDTQENFDEDLEVTTPCGKKMYFRDALSVLGFSFTATTEPGKLLATTGHVQLATLPDKFTWALDVKIAKLVSDLVAAVPTSRGSIFESICIYCIQKIFGADQLRRVDEALPHFAGSEVGAMQIGSIQPDIITLPKIVREKNVTRLTADEMNLPPMKCLGKRCEEKKDMDHADFSSILSKAVGTLCVILRSAPASATQDWFIVLFGHVIGIANKCYISSPLFPNDLIDEWRKRPRGVKNYTLVVYATSFSPGLLKIEGFKENGFCFWEGDDSDGPARVLLVHPDHRDGLPSLLGPDVMSQINKLKEREASKKASKEG